MRHQAPRSPSSSSGFTVVELLVTAAIVAVVLGILTAFFAAQTRVGLSIQDRNEVENKLKAVAEIVMQDVQQAGSVATYASGVPEYAVDDLGPGCTRSVRSGCIVTSVDGSVVTTLYLTSLVRPDGSGWGLGGDAACRRVDYSITDNVFSRRDVRCDAWPAGFEGFDLASGITAVTVQFTCALPGDPFDDPSLCYDAGSYPREALITVKGESEGSRDPVASTVKLSTTVPNLRPPVSFGE